jgi:hypothetical protein
MVCSKLLQRGRYNLLNYLFTKAQRFYILATMKKMPILIALLLLCNMTLHAQTIEGVIKDTKTNNNLSFVNVGIIGKATGTVTDDNGHFSLTLNNNDTDSLKISIIGYIPKTFLVNDYIKNYSAGKVILLSPVVYQLAEVKIHSDKLKQSVLGNTTQSKTTNAGFTSNKLGNEIGAIIKIKRSPTYLKQFNASLAHEVTDSVKLRLNFYGVKDGLPDKILQQQNIFVTVKKGQEQITVDLTPYNIVVQDKFFVSLEWIQNSAGRGIMFSASILSSAIIARETSQANWEKLGLAGVGFNVLAAY